MLFKDVGYKYKNFAILAIEVFPLSAANNSVQQCRACSLGNGNSSKELPNINTTGAAVEFEQHAWACPPRAHRSVWSDPCCFVTAVAPAGWYHLVFPKPKHNWYFWPCPDLFTANNVVKLLQSQMHSCWDAQFTKHENCKYTAAGVRQAIKQESNSQIMWSKCHKKKKRSNRS